MAFIVKLGLVFERRYSTGDVLVARKKEGLSGTRALLRGKSMQR